MEHNIETITYVVNIGNGALNFYDSSLLRERVAEIGGKVYFRGHSGNGDRWHYRITLPSEAMVFFKLKYGTSDENIA